MCDQADRNIYRGAALLLWLTVKGVGNYRERLLNGIGVNNNAWNTTGCPAIRETPVPSTKGPYRKA